MKPEIVTAYPLAPMQQGMLFHHLQDEQSGIDIEQILCTLNEVLDVDLLAQAWQRVVGRHDVLRTSFIWQGLSEPIQQVHSYVAVELRQLDWRGLTTPETQQHLLRLLAEDRLRGFDLSRVPLMRLVLCSVAESQHHLIWTFHHSILDGRSFTILLKEVFAVYHGLVKGIEVVLPVPHRYRDFVDWIRGLDYSTAELYWRNTLKGSSGLISAHLESDALRTGSKEERYGVLCGELSMEASSALKALTVGGRFTPNTFVQGAWALTLSRFGGEEDVLFGATRACRHWTSQDADSRVGLFINTLPVRVRVNPSQAVMDWMLELREQQLAVRPYEHSPLMSVQSWAGSRAGRPMFESLLVFERSDLGFGLRSQGGTWLGRHFELRERTNYPLTVYGFAEPHLHFKLAYDRRRFDDSIVAGLLNHMCVSLERMVAGIEGSVEAISGLGKAALNRLVHEWNATSKPYNTGRCIHHLIEDQVKRTFGSVHAFVLSFFAEEQVKPVLDFCQVSL